MLDRATHPADQDDLNSLKPVLQSGSALHPQPIHHRHPMALIRSGVSGERAVRRRSCIDPKGEAWRVWLLSRVSARSPGRHQDLALITVESANVGGLLATLTNFSSPPNERSSSFSSSSTSASSASIASPAAGSRGDVAWCSLPPPIVTTAAPLRFV